MPPPPTSSLSTSNTMPPPFGSNTMPPHPTPCGSNTMPSHATPGSNTNADMEDVYEMERKQIAIDVDDQFWEDCVREFDHVEEHMAQDKCMPEDVSAGKIIMAHYKGMPEDVSAGKQPMIKYDSLEVRAYLPTQESTVEANPKPTRSKKSKAAEYPN
nr:hypothetical protein [Tanacetum cinerariifolium]